MDDMKNMGRWVLQKTICTGQVFLSLHMVKLNEITVITRKRYNNNLWT